MNCQFSVVKYGMKGKSVLDDDTVFFQALTNSNQSMRSYPKLVSNTYSLEDALKPEAMEFTEYFQHGYKIKPLTHVLLPF